MRSVSQRNARPRIINLRARTDRERVSTYSTVPVKASYYGSTVQYWMSVSRLFETGCLSVLT